MSRKKMTIYIDSFISLMYQKLMNERKMYNTTLNIDLLRKLKVLAAQTDRRQNDLLEEAIKNLLEKYEKPKE